MLNLTAAVAAVAAAEEAVTVAENNMDQLFALSYGGTMEQYHEADKAVQYATMGLSHSIALVMDAKMSAAAEVVAEAEAALEAAQDAMTELAIDALPARFNAECDKLYEASEVALVELAHAQALLQVVSR